MNKKFLQTMALTAFALIGLVGSDSMAETKAECLTRCKENYNSCMKTFTSQRVRNTKCGTPYGECDRGCSIANIIKPH